MLVRYCDLTCMESVACVGSNESDAWKVVLKRSHSPTRRDLTYLFGVGVNVHDNAIRILLYLVPVTNINLVSEEGKTTSVHQILH